MLASASCSPTISGVETDETFVGPAGTWDSPTVAEGETTGIYTQSPTPKKNRPRPHPSSRDRLTATLSTVPGPSPNTPPETPSAATEPTTRPSPWHRTAGLRALYYRTPRPQDPPEFEEDQ